MLPDPKLNFWAHTPAPLIVLAPMEDVTDTAFRELVMHISQPGQLHVVYTEFTSTDGLCHPVGRKRVEERLKVSQTERQLLRENNVKIVAQIWGKNPDKYRQAMQYISDNYEFDGIDINMGCPVRKVVAHGSCSALIDNESLAGEIIDATRQGTHLPLSVKTRLGVKNVDTERWMKFLLKQPLEAIILHGRIQKQMSEGLADWNQIALAASLRNQMAPHIKIIGNGDVESVQEGHEKTGQYQTDGVMIGRGIFKNPWLFNPHKIHINREEKLQTLLLHLQLYERSWGSLKNFAILRRFFKIYLTGFDGAAVLRARLMQVNNYEDARESIREFNAFVAKSETITILS